MSHADELSPSACPASPWPAAVEAGQPVRPEERAVSIPATRTPPDDHPDSYVLPAPVSRPGEASPSVDDRPVSDPPAADRSDHDPLAAGWTGTERAALTGRVEHEYHALPTSIADAPPAPDRRQLHLYAGVTVVGVLLSDGSSRTRWMYVPRRRRRLRLRTPRNGWPLCCALTSTPRRRMSRLRRLACGMAWTVSRAVLPYGPPMPAGCGLLLAGSPSCTPMRRSNWVRPTRHVPWPRRDTRTGCGRRTARCKDQPARSQQ